MSELKGKIDFLLLVTVNDANPNGDPLNGNRPRENFDGYGEISDVCIKRKIRNRWQDMGQKIFVQSDDRKDDGYGSLKERAEGCAELQTEIKKGKKADRDLCAEIACRNGWMYAALARFLLLRELRCLLAYVDRYPFIRRSALRRWIQSACRLQRVLTAKRRKAAAKRPIPWEQSTE